MTTRINDEMPIRSISEMKSNAWRDAFVHHEKGTRYTKQDFDKLKADYVAKYGYALAIPDFNDIIHWKSPEAMTPQELKDKKLRSLQQVLASPSPEIARKYSSMMTWLDNVQDAMTVGVVAAQILIRLAPRIMSRFVPGLGWVILAYDVLNIVNMLARTPMTPLNIKRNTCHMIRDNPFTKKAQRFRLFKLRRLKPTFGNLLEVAQTLDNVAGVGLCLGGIVGTIQDTAFGAYRSIKGEKVTAGWNMPKVDMREFLATQGQKGAAMINAGGQTFDDELHFWTYVTAAGSAVITSPLMEEENLWDIITDPMSTILPAPRPTDPITLAVIQEAGLDIDAGIGWPANGKTEISMDELTDWQAPRLRESFQNFSERHKKDWYGFITATMTEQANTMIFDSIEPGADKIETYTPAVHVIMQMTKMGIWFDGTPTPEVWMPFEDWCNQFWEHYGDYPGVREARNKLDLLGIPTTTTQPADYPAEIRSLFPPEALDESLWTQEYT